MLTHRYSAAFWLAIYLALQNITFLFRFRTRSVIARDALDLLSIGLFILLALCICASISKQIRRPLPALLLVLIGVLGWGATLLLGGQPPNPPNLLTMGKGFLMLLHTSEELSRILAAVGVGALVATVIRERNILLPMAVFAAFADYFVVFIWGPVQQALQGGAKGQQQISGMSAKVPSLHGDSAALATVGMADFVFLALFFACVHRFDLNLRSTFTALFLMLTPALYFALKIGAIPALAPMALAFVLANFRRFKLSRSEKQAMVTAAVLVAIAVFGLLMWKRTLQGA